MEDKGTNAQSNINDIIVVKHIKKSYKGKKILDINSLGIEKGKITAIAGYSGSGKTSFLNIVGLLDDPDHSENALYHCDGLEIRFENKKWQELKEKEEFINIRQKYFGYIFQDNYLPQHLNLMRALSWSRELNGAPKMDRQGIEEIFNKLNLLPNNDLNNLPRLKKKYPHELAKGEAQRVAIAMAIVKKPKIILADEPTSNLDHNNGSLVMAWLKEWVRKEGNTIIWVSHDMHLVCEYADIIHLMRDGIIVKSYDNRETPITPTQLMEAFDRKVAS